MKDNFIRRKENIVIEKMKKRPNAIKTSFQTYIKIFHTDTCLVLGGTKTPRNTLFTLVLIIIIIRKRKASSDEGVDESVKLRTANCHYEHRRPFIYMLHTPHGIRKLK